MDASTVDSGAAISFRYADEACRTSDDELSYGGPLSVPGGQKGPVPVIVTYPGYSARGAACGAVDQTNWPLSAILVAGFLVGVTAVSTWKIWEILECCSGWNL